MKRCLNVLGKDVKTWTWSRNKLVCSNHFRSEDFIIKGGRKTLKFSAVHFIAEVERSVDISQPSKRKSLHQKAPLCQKVHLNIQNHQLQLQKGVAAKDMLKPNKIKLR